MAQEQPIEKFMREANDRLIEDGRDADLRDVMLAGFSYLADKFDSKNGKTQLKKTAAVGGSGLGIGAGMLELFQRLFGG